MQKRINNSLSIKVFLWVFFALMICSTLIYGIVLTVLPKQYQINADKQLDSNIEMLVSKVRDMSYDEAVKEIYNFCIENNSAAVLNGEGETLRFGEMKSETYTVASSSIATNVTFSESEKEYTLVISVLAQTSDAMLHFMLRFLPVVFSIILLLSALSAFVCSKVIVTPIAKLSEISKRMISLDEGWKCDIKNNDEIGVLASSLNTMATRLYETMQELTNANQQLNNDIERFKLLEEQRRDFFEAISHELKTPLTILKGQIENMILGYGDYQNHEKYLPEALKATEDIEHLVGEIISISKMESIEINGTLQEISLMKTVDDTVHILMPLAQEKEIHIYQNIKKDIRLRVNDSLWRKALSNILGNAVRHSPNGEKVYIELQEDEKLLVVENTGIYIPEEDMSNMFHPFYRADKSRSKSTGGSGLGLYIVKKILDLHGMKYSISNTESGVAFSIYIRE